jgi:hypothetical protein
LYRGQDADFDLLHYHLYNPYAWLTGRVGRDLAPGGMQSYFNPLLDVPFYMMETHWPAPLAGLAMGCLHGLGFPLLLGICRSVLAPLPAADRHRLPLLLALAGCLTTNFLTSLGNAMGDATTMLFDLGALLLLLLRSADGGGRDLLRQAILPAMAGLVLGAGIGLKLTNAVYAPALCLAALALPGGIFARFRVGVLVGCGVLAGIGVTGGAWFAEMDRLFGNPFFPQFSDIFPNPLVQPAGVMDTAWRPRGWGEAALWPFVFTADPLRVGQLAFRQIIWPAAYVLTLLWIVRAVATARGRAEVRRPGRTLAVIVFAIVAYAVWAGVFSIFRYIVALEMLLPLLTWILLTALLPPWIARPAAAALIGLATLVFLGGGVGDWGTAAWASRALRADTPILQHPASTTILFAGQKHPPHYAEPPRQFVALFFPPDVTFIGPLNLETQVYRDHLRVISANRGGPVYAIFPTVHDGHAEKQAALDRQAAAWGLTRSARRCAVLGWAMRHLRSRTTLQRTEAGSGGEACRMVLPFGAPEDIVGENRALVADTAASVVEYGFEMRQESCTIYPAFVGQKSLPYHFCELRLLSLTWTDGAAPDK